MDDFSTLSARRGRRRKSDPLPDGTSPPGERGRARPTAAASSLPDLSYEHHPGAASAPLPSSYRRHEPEKTILHQVVREHLETLLAQGRARDGEGYPRWVERQFRDYLDCALLSQGFARLRCPRCGFERLRAFSCKTRVCPSCCARRAAETAATLVDELLPEAEYRQWVLTFPWALRFRLAVDGRLFSSMLRSFFNVLFAWQRRQARERGFAVVHPGGLACIQRMGGALNANLHVHAVLPDGVFVEAAGGEAAAAKNNSPAGSRSSASGEAASGRAAGARPSLRFLSLPAPTDTEVEDLLRAIAEGGAASLARAREDQEGGPLEPDLAGLYEDLMLAVHAPAVRAHAFSGGGGDDHQEGREGSAPFSGQPLCSHLGGFSLHAARWVASHDRQGLERLLRYGLRPPLAGPRLGLTPEGRVLYTLRRPWPKPGGRTQLVLEPVEFLRRLVALLPRPYTHAIRYYGVFSNRSRARPRLPAPPLDGTLPLSAEPTLPEPAGALAGAAAACGVTAPPRRRRLLWHQLLRRVFFVEALNCPRCSLPRQPVPMAVLAIITDPPVIHRILEHLRLPSSAPAVAPARPAPEPVAWPRTSLSPAVAAPPMSLPFELPADCPDEAGPDDDGARWREGEPPCPIRPPP